MGSMNLPTRCQEWRKVVDFWKLRITWIWNHYKQKKTDLLFKDVIFRGRQNQTAKNGLVSQIQALNGYLRTAYPEMQSLKLEDGRKLLVE